MIRIEKDKIINTNHREESKEINNTDLPFYLNAHIEIGEGVTFERMFDLIIENKSLFNIIFSGDMGGYLIDYYIEDFIDKPDEEGDFFKNVSHCEVYRIFEHMMFDDGDEDNSMYMGFHAKGNPPDETNYGFMGSRICEYKHLPIKVDNHVDFQVDTGGKLHGKSAVDINDKYKIIHKGDISITVFEFIGAILHEITWMGKPEEREAEFDKLKEISDRIDSGEEELIEMKWDDDGEMYFLDKDGNKDYPFGKDDE